MKSLLIVGCDIDQKQAYYDEYKAFFARSSEGVSVSIVDVCDILLACGDDDIIAHDMKHDRPVNEYDIVMWRGAGIRRYDDMLRVVGVYCRRYSVKYMNDIFVGHQQSKLSQAAFFFDHNLPVAMTIAVNRAAFAGRDLLPITFPCIMKAVNGAHGKDNYVVHTIEEARAIDEASPGTRYVWQRFIENDGDYRVLVLGGDTLIIKRTSTDGTHLNNTSQGGVAQLANAEELPAQAIADAKKVAAILNMDIAGVDIITDKARQNEHTLLEINTQPQLMTGAYIEDKALLLKRYFNQF